jgi:hypothetical protein
MTTLQSQDHQPLTYTSPSKRSWSRSKRGASRSAHSPSVRAGHKPRLHKPQTRGFANHGVGGRPGFSASANLDFTRPAFGSVQVGEGRFFWIAFRRLRDWLENGEPLDSGYIGNEVQAHDKARVEVRPYLSHKEPLPPMPEAWVQAHHDRMVAEQTAREAAARWLARIEDDGSIGGYSWKEVCEENDFDLIDLTADEDDGDSLQAMDEDEAEAA